jgi:3-hydroxyisobutyrate dehydrogenase-like beta-hydroxyacid dehydrogenase
MEQVIDVVDGENGIVASLPGDATRRVILSTSTVEPEGIETLALRIAETKHALLDAPASGTSLQVMRGESLGLIAGDRDAIAATEELLQAIYPQRCYVGGAGAGTKTKLAINLILGLNRIALAEGLVFAERLGLDLETFFEIARKSAAYSQVMDHKGQKMITANYEPISKVSPHLKDVRTMLHEAKRCGQTLPLATVLSNVLEACEKHGDGDADNAVMIEEIRRRIQ